MDYLTLDEIIYITRFLDLKNTFNFLKSLKWNLTYNLEKSLILKNKKLMVVELLYNVYLENQGSEQSQILKELLEFFHRDIDVEDLICFMANVYPNYPRLEDTILFDLLKLYNFSMVDWSLVQVHFRIKRSQRYNLTYSR